MFAGLGEIVIFILITGAAIFILWLVLKIFYILTLYRTLKATEEYHTVSPGLVWLLLIPVFYLGWQFYILDGITKGIKGKYGANGRDCDDAAYGIGLAFCILVCANFIPYLNFITAVPCFVLWIIYWLKIAGFREEMEMMLL